MPTRKSKKIKPEYIFSSFKVKKHSSHINMSVNHDIYDKRYAYEKTKIFSFHNHFELSGKYSYPDERLNQSITITIYTKDIDDFELNSVLDDYHVKDKDGFRKYKKRNGKETPIYEHPESIGFMERIRIRKSWQGCVWLHPQVGSDMLALIASGKTIYLSADEIKLGKKHLIRGVTLQTTNPAFE